MPWAQFPIREGKHLGSPYLEMTQFYKLLGTALQNWIFKKIVSDFIFLGFKITVGSDWSHEIKRHLVFRKAMTNLDTV